MRTLKRTVIVTPAKVSLFACAMLIILMFAKLGIVAQASMLAYEVIYLSKIVVRNIS